MSMGNLKHDWLTEGMIDYEYKKYVLLAYLQDIKKRFNLTELYPFLSDLVFHYRNLQRIKDSKQLIYESFPKTITKADFKKLEFTYHKIIQDDDMMKELEDIIAFALPQMEKTINEGKELYEFVEENLEIGPVGVTPIYAREGYMLVNQDAARDVSIFRYQLSVFENSEENYRGISTSYVQDDFRDFSRSFEQIKLDLVRKFKELPNPATYLVVSKLSFPLPQTILPVAKRLLVRLIS